MPPQISSSLDFENKGANKPFILFVVLVSIAPWIIGSNFPFVRTGLLGLVALMGVLSLTNGFVGSMTKRGWCLLAIFVLAIFYSAIQIWVPGWGGTSAYPAESRVRLAELILPIAAFMVAYVGFRTQQTFVVAFAIIAANGFLLSFFGITQKLAYNGKIFWLYELIHGGVPFGPFVNRNNGAGYLLMCFGAATFFVARHVIRNSNLRSQRTNSTRSIMDAFSNGLQSLWVAFGQIEPKQLFQFSALVMLVCGIVFSLSRGASVALLVSVLAAWVMLIRYNRASIVLLLMLILCGGGVAIWVGQLEKVSTRLESLADLPKAAEPRFEHWLDASSYVKDYWMTGSGLGTYRYLYPAYVESSLESWFLHAENQYLETLAEVGIFGLILLTASICILYSCCLSLLLVTSSESRAIGIVGLVALTGQVISSAFDFGLYQPGNSVLLAIMMAAVMARLDWSLLQTDRKTAATESSPSRGHSTRAWAGILMVATSVMACWGAYEYSSVDARNLARFRLERLKPTGKVEEHFDKIAGCKSLLNYALTIRPDDSEAHFQLGVAYSLSYRLQAAQDLLDEAASIRKEIENRNSNPNAPQTDGGVGADNQLDLSPEMVGRLPTSFDQVWPLTTITALNRAAWVAMRSEPSVFENLQNDSAVKKHLEPAYQQFQLAEEDCQLLPKTQIRLAELSILFATPEKQAEHLDEAVKRWPTNPEVMFNIGLLSHHAANVDRTVALWRQCLLRTRKFDEPIFRYSRYELSMKQFFESVLPSDPVFLLRTANKYFGNPNDKLVRNLLLGHTKRVLDADNEVADPLRSYLQAEIDSAFGYQDLAEANYQAALDAEPDNIEWRIAYVRLLQDLGKYEEAGAELRICSLQRETKYVRIIQRLITKNNREKKKALKSFGRSRPY